MSLSFKHSGDLGDCGYSLCLIKALGGGSLFLSQSTATRELMTPERAAFLLPLIRSQSYINHADVWRGQAVAYNLDYFREYWSKTVSDRGFNDGTTLAEWHCLAFGVDPIVTEKPWLEIEPHEVAPVVINRTERYHGHSFPWKRVVERYKGKAVFVGLPDEHQKFTAEFGKIPHYKVKDCLELGQVISGCKLFIGNPSLPESICEGLKKQKILEVSILPTSTAHARPNAQNVFTKNIWFPEV